MTVNGLKLPEAFVALIDRPDPILWWAPKGGNERWIYRGGEGSVYWVPEGTPDRYDHLNYLELITNLDKIVEETNLLPWTHVVEEYSQQEIEEWNASCANKRGFIPFITDFAHIVQFGYAGDGAAYCFDYRKNLNDSSVIHWAETYWRRMAPSFERFIDCFEPV